MEEDESLMMVKSHDVSSESRNKIRSPDIQQDTKNDEINAVTARVGELEVELSLKRPKLTMQNQIWKNGRSNFRTVLGMISLLIVRL